MREAVMSAAVFGIADTRHPDARAQVSAEGKTLCEVESWNPANFAREEIRRLVRQIFTSNVPGLRRQIVFSGVDPETDIGGLCLRVGEALAMETPADIAVVGTLRGAIEPPERYELSDYTKNRYTPLRLIAKQVRPNLWLVPVEEKKEQCSATFLHAYLSEVRREFEYSIVQSPAASESNQATTMAQFADGMVLVLSAQRTRRAAARKIKQALLEAQVRLLGAVLSDREFPLPEALYRRL